ncbi:radical SAM protein [Candidatus Woesearchaeota archaeon]|nr:radical SAM protein [Candidatus Woesearchaeota archaeon]
MIPENQYYSYNLGELPLGCQFCVKGEKLVLFVTGICPRRCYFCPVSDQKYGKDVEFANERPVIEEADIIAEAQAMDAKGAGITGGDPLSKLDRTISCIKLLKSKFGKQFHIHLYTSLILVNEKSMKELYESGLDEIRFHLDLDSSEIWNRIKLAKKYSWDIGVEIPCIPGKEKETRKIIDFVHNKVAFLNLNELEMADNSLSTLGEIGYKTKDELSYAILGSKDMGLEMIEYVKNKKYTLPVHFCTAKLKDAVQLTNRIKRESAHVKHDFDHADEEGMLTRGAAYLPELAPGFDYRKKLDMVDKLAVIEKLKPIVEKMKKELKFKDNEFYLDPLKPRIIFSRKNARVYNKWFKEQGLMVAIVVEYPTADQLEIEVDFLE